MVEYVWANLLLAPTRRSRHFLCVVLMSSILALVGASGAAATSFEDLETQRLLSQAADNYRTIGEALGNPRLSELSTSMAQVAPAVTSEALRRGRTHDEFRRVLRRQVDLTSQIAEQLPGLIETRSIQISGSSDWPSASCDVTDPPNTGDPGSAGWTTFLAALGTLSAAVEAEMLAAEGCYKIEALEIVSDPAVLDGECIDEVEAATGILEVTDPGDNSWEGARNLPSVCTPYDSAIVAAQLVVSNLKLVLGCWSSGKISATLGRLPTLKESLEPIIEQAELIRRIFVELNLHKKSGSALATLYLPESQCGQLETARRYTDDAIWQTSAAGYEIDEKTNGFLTEANSAFAAGDYKRAFERFRRAYRQATAHSIRYEP